MHLQRNPVATGADAMKLQRAEIALKFIESYPQSKVVPPVNISSGFDRSVHLVGSSISTLKPWITRGIPANGVIAAQPAVRTQNLRTLGDCSTEFFWGGYFTNFSILHPIDERTVLAENTLSFFLEACGFMPQDVIVRATRQHKNLIPAVNIFAKNVRVEWDSRPAKYYTHRIGLSDIQGVNFNVALRHSGTQDFDDVGNYIHFSSVDFPTRECFAEVGFGDTTILRAREGLEHVLDSFSFSSPLVNDYWTNRHIQDAFLVASILWNEGLRPSNRDGKTKLLRKYLEACRSVVLKGNLRKSEVYAWLSDLYIAEGMPESDFDSIWTENMERNLWI